MSNTPSTALMIGATSSGAGKTTITLGLLRAFRQRGLDIRAAKCGPDYIDPRFHEAACGSVCGNLDSFAMSPKRLDARLPRGELTIVEGVMGLFDGAAGGRGSTAELAQILGLPVILIVDAARMAQSAGALVNGFAGHRSDVRVAGVILNNVGSARHERLLRDAIHLPVLGAVPRNKELAIPSRHLGLVQASEREELDGFIDLAAAHVADHVDLDALARLAAPLDPAPTLPVQSPPASRIAVARDTAFAFFYPHQIADWQAGGAAVTYFSPLADEAPAADAEMVFLPGGYPELFAAKLAGARNFHAGIREAADRGSVIYGECGGYMALGEVLIDGKGHSHQMLGLLPLVTSFETPKLHLGYRTLRADTGYLTGQFAGHEFHYARTLRAEGEPLFQARGGWDEPVGEMGLVNGGVWGSYAHVIDKLDDT